MNENNRAEDAAQNEAAYDAAKSKPMVIEEEIKAVYEQYLEARRKLDEIKARHPASYEVAIGANDAVEEVRTTPSESASPSAAVRNEAGEAFAHEERPQPRPSAPQMPPIPEPTSGSAQQSAGWQGRDSGGSVDANGRQQPNRPDCAPWQQASTTEQPGGGRMHGQSQPPYQAAGQQPPYQAGYQQPPYQAGYQQPYYTSQYVHSKDHVAAGLLGIFLGTFGVHKFYLGYNTAGFIMLAVTVLGSLFTFGIAGSVMFVVGVVEGIVYLTKTQTDFEQLYVFNRREWF